MVIEIWRQALGKTACYLYRYTLQELIRTHVNRCLASSLLINIKSPQSYLINAEKEVTVFPAREFFSSWSFLCALLFSFDAVECDSTWTCFLLLIPITRSVLVDMVIVFVFLTPSPVASCQRRQWLLLSRTRPLISWCRGCGRPGGGRVIRQE